MKKILLVISILALFASLVLCVNAHPGRTDSYGGHTNHSTGEYHYHHGYSAHDHYDMDGDGDADCPYNFDRQTNHNSDDDYRTVSKDNQIEEKDTETITNKEKNKDLFSDLWVKIIIILALVGIWISPIFLKGKS